MSHPLLHRAILHHESLPLGSISAALHLTWRPWAKLRLEHGKLERLALEQHSMDVAAVFEALIAISVVRARLERLAQCAMTTTSIARLSVLAFLHDVGKASAGFQSKVVPDEVRPSWLSRAGIRPHQCGHTHVVAGLLFDAGRAQRMAEGFPLAEMLRWGESMLDLWLASISHHGEPITASALKRAPEAHWPALWRPIDGYDPMHAVAELGRHAQAQFPDAWHGDGELPAEPAFAHCFAGLVSLADWIASNDRSDFFPYDLGRDSCRATASRVRARQVVRCMRLDMDGARTVLRTRAPSFGEIFAEDGRAFEPTPLQKAMESPDLGPVVVVESETGSGKTEAALWRFRTLFEAGEVDSLAFLLPTRVAAISLERRVRMCIERLFTDPEERPNVVLAVPGYIQADGERAEPLARFEVLWPDSGEQAAAHRRWAAESPKRFLAAAVMVGTVDQALLAGLPVRHAHLRGAALLRALMVVDEVHASDAYMTQLLAGLLRRHTQAGGHALLLSATLGSEARDGLLAAPQARLRPNERRAEAPALSGLAPYPSIADISGIRPVAGRPLRKQVRICPAPVIDDAARIAARAAGAACQGAKVLVVRNTVAGAVAVQAALERELGTGHPVLWRVGTVPAPHHGRFASQDRRLLDEAVETSFGKDADRGTGTVLVGTQTLEQSLDIDADYLLTDLAPGDVLLQRLGRLHRHGRHSRPAGFATPTVTILTPSSRDLGPYLERKRGWTSHGLGTVYENLLSIEATWRELECRHDLSLPEENRSIVEKVTHSAELGALASELGAAWVRHWESYTGAEAAKRGGARIIYLDWSQPWDEQQRWTELGSRLRTRLGLDDRLVSFDKVWSSPFGQTVDRLKIPGWMAGDAPEIEETATMLAPAGEKVRFCWADRRFAYGRYGLEMEGEAP